MLARLRVDCASKSGGQRRQSGCLVPGMWGVDDIKGSNAMENDRRKKVIRVHHNPMRQQTYNDGGQTINGDFPATSTNCEKPIIW